MSVSSHARRLLLTVLVPCLLVLAATLPARAGDPDLISFTGAYYDVNHRRHPAAEGRIEFRSHHRFWWFKPFGGIMATSTRSAYGYAGVLIDFYFGKHFVVTPSFAPGIYFQGGGERLGFPLEFRSQIEVSYRFDDHSRLGVSFGHMSNAGLGTINPGTEALAVTYAIPFDRLFGGF